MDSFGVLPPAEMEMEEVKFHVRLRLLREKRGFSMKKMAQLSNIPESTYREWEYGRAIQGEPYLAMARVLGVSVHELLSGEHPSHSGILRDMERIISELSTLKRSLESVL